MQEKLAPGAKSLAQLVSSVQVVPPSFVRLTNLSEIGLAGTDITGDLDFFACDEGT